ncbi:Rtg1p SCDLUD_005063 [Saccharomycodes ludwigii]|uniref:Rtg1p n=1 Tax=Saccharomycodes ludwigii TaxID=36035 RepID=UPI001E85A8BF|nr:hypothetical protein SCDLUD_005063 [Saccharomycodes ludwigii]KAH3898736.1 hypothetical protein SCDLUD_005063 [Saccharomycodes ludwigii]
MTDDNRNAKKGGDTRCLEDINSKIQEMLEVIPPEYFKERRKFGKTKDGKPNKGKILTEGVNYLLNLQNQVDLNNREEIELLNRLKTLMGERGVSLDQLGLPHEGLLNLENTSAEIELGKIGVGPLAAVPNRNSGNSDINNSNGNDHTPTETLAGSGYNQYE